MGGSEQKVNFWGDEWGCLEVWDSCVADVFISYKREDRPRVAIIADLLADLGLTVWFDAALMSGDRWRAVVDREAAQAKAMLVCWTPASVASVQVLREVLEGLKKGILAPVNLEACTPPAELKAQHAANLCDWNFALDNREWLQLLTKLEQLTGNQKLVEASKARAAGQAAASLMRRILIQTAKDGRLMSYAYGVVALQRALDEAHREHAPRVNNHFLYGALDATAAENRTRREPPLCVSVVNKTGRPGRGYFQKHAFLSDHDDPCAQDIFERHIERVRSWDWEF